MRAASLVILLSLAAYGADTMVSPQSVILPTEFGPALVKSCWGKSPIAGDISGYWTPTIDDARQMEQALPGYLKHSEVQPAILRLLPTICRHHCRREAPRICQRVYQTIAEW